MKSNKIGIYILIGIYFISLLAIFKSHNNPYLWFDEAGQFFVSKGLNHDSNPLEKEKGLTYVIESNSSYNMDPGGFGIFLHFWSIISNSHTWLRILPFLFFLGIILSFIFLSFLWLKNINISLLMGFIPILIPMILNTGFELRAFSMEGLGTVLCIIALEKLKIKISYKYLFLWGCIFSFFITSRYSEIIVVFVVSIYIIYLIYISSISFKKKMLFIVAYSIPLLFTLTYIYFFALIFQNKNLEPVPYLPYISNNKYILIATNNFLFLCAIFLLIILFFLRNKYSIIKKYKILLFVTIIVNLLFIILSFLGKHPWSSYSSRCISLFLLVLLCISAFIGEIIILIFNRMGNLKYYILLTLLIFIIFIRKGNLFFKQDKNNTYYNIVKIDITKYNRIYVDRWESPCIRYLYEYGELKTKTDGIYPNKFTFGKLYKHGFNENNLTLEDFYKSQPKMNDFLDYSLLITPELYNYGNNDKWILIDGTSDLFIKKDNNIETQ